MTNAKLEKWAQLLLDLGKSNNLINFKDRKSSTLEFIAPDSDVLFHKLNGDSELEVFNPKLDEEDFEEDLDEENTQLTIEKVSRNDFIFKYGSKLKKNQILPFSASASPIRALKTISKKAKTAIEETGVNIAYMAFGFIHWTERDDSNVKFKAPILLIPVSIRNDSSVTPYYISATDDDVILNPTFNYKLSSEFNVSLPEYEGQELSEYLSLIDSIVRKLHWSVSSEVKLGIFSFLKINMYHDLKDNASKILKSGIVRGMMGESYQDNYSDGSTQAKNNLPTLFHNVVDADSSQLEAIQLAKSGKSFVLQGPPGTGKSQTITNIIAECLMDGKKVLFVSEKLAALEVVYEKLKKAGLEEFCLQLHSYKANKKSVIEDLERTLKLAKSGVSSKADAELATLEKARKQLDSYERELHKVRTTIDLSLYSLFEKYSAFRKLKNIDFIIPDIKMKGATYLGGAIERLEKYVSLTSSIGFNYKNNAWYGYIVQDSSYAAELQTKTQFNDILQTAIGLEEIANEIYGNYAIKCDDIDSLTATIELLRIVGENKFIFAELLASDTISSLIKTVEEMESLSANIKSARNALSQTFDDDLYKLDGATAYKKFTKQFNNGFKRLFSKEFKSLANEFKLCSKNGKKLKYRALCENALQLKAVQEAQHQFAAFEEKVQKYLNIAYQGLDTEWQPVLKQLNNLQACIKKIKSIGKLSSINNVEFENERECFIAIYDKANALLTDNKSLINLVCGSFDKDVFNLKSASFAQISNKIESCIKEFDVRNNWIIFNKLLNDMQMNGLKSFVDFCIEHNLPTADYPALFQKVFYKQWIDYVIHDSEVLTEFNRASQDKAVSVFTQKDKLQFEINKAKIKQVLSATRPDLNFVANGSSISILLREAQKKRKQKPIRQLLGEIADLVQILKPCFMMSPLSVSTFLDSDKISFDTVVFDEASQIFPQDAVGAIYRGKQVIVVGDSKQMPPSNFFNAMTGSDEYDDEDEDIADFESILDLCSTTMPQLRLKWHYRSRFEELISFSNKNFYEGDLISFPSAQKKVTGIGVDYYYVNGIFDRKTKTNRAEAEFIVDLIYQHFEKYPQRSLGVVAFSASQQDLIEKCLSKRRQADSSKEEFFKADKNEPFFIKNLETVQGDERDTIIFSMAYARDSQGRFMANFGPVNRSGGERRLNVAVTRAKYNVQFVASVHSYDVDLKGSQSVGARLLREYLDFAENGMIALDRSLEVNQFEQFDSDFEMEVYDFLTEKGFALDTQVGCSKFKIDLALKKPNTSEYLLAIECDGATYHSSATARDRDRLRQQILENMGWKFYRIWSTDWFRNNRVEKERLLAAASEAVKVGTSLNTPVAPKGEESEKKFDFVESKPSIKLKFPYYRVMPVNKAYEKAGRNFVWMVKEILNVEAPLSEEWLLKRAVYLFGREKVTNVVTSNYEYRMSDCRRYGIIRHSGFLYLEGKNVPMLRIPDGNNYETQRDVKYICLEELANGMREIIKHNVTVTKDGLFKGLVTELGFNRMGEAITARLNEAIKLLSKEIRINGDMISLK